MLLLPVICKKLLFQVLAQTCKELEQEPLVRFAGLFSQMGRRPSIAFIFHSIYTIFGSSSQPAWRTILGGYLVIPFVFTWIARWASRVENDLGVCYEYTAACLGCR